MIPKTHDGQLINTAQKMKFSIKDFFSKCDQIRSKLVKRSSDSLVALKNANSSTINLIDLGQVTDTSRWFFKFKFPWENIQKE